MKQIITGETQTIALLGDPVSHSISPLIHNEAFKLLNLNYLYSCYRVKKEDLKEAVNGIRALGFAGFNLTMPHKKSVMEFLDYISPEARLIGAVNTVVNENGVLSGYNTDGYGFMKSVNYNKANYPINFMTLIGAGGASFSICVEAAFQGVKTINVFSRKSESLTAIRGLGEKLSLETKCFFNVYDINDTKKLNESIQYSELLVNTSPVGMKESLNDSPIEDFSSFHPNLLVADIIYEPKETLFLKKASSLSCQTMNGSLMLLFQGEKGFKLWTKKDMPILEIKRKFFS